MGTADRQNGTRQLDTWKEIAAHLGVSIRTAQYWAKHGGMPVQHLPGLKTRVWTSAEELDRWKEQSSTGLATEEEIAREPRWLLHWPSWLSWREVALAALALAVTLAAFDIVRLLPKGQPARWRVEGKTLVVSDEHNRDLWEFVLPEVPVRLENFITAEREGARFADIDGDGQTEMLYSYVVAGRSEGRLYCFRSDGRLWWKHDAGRPVTTVGGERLNSPYVVRVVGTLRKPRPDGGIIVVGATCGPSWLFVVEVLTADGRKVAEYFHPGWLLSMLITDLDGDGREEILLGGANNAWYDQGYGGATLVVLDSTRVAGQGPVPPGDGRQVSGVPIGLEKAVILFREFARGTRSDEYCRVATLKRTHDGIEVWVRGLKTATFRLDSRLRLSGVAAESSYEDKLLRHLPPGTLGPERMAELHRALAHIKVLRNEYDPSYKGTDPE